jgi:hypothetical protein
MKIKVGMKIKVAKLDKDGNRDLSLGKKEYKVLGIYPHIVLLVRVVKGKVRMYDRWGISKQELKRVIVN